MSKTQNKECLMCGIKISETNYYPAFDLEQNKCLYFCCRECFERYGKFEDMVRKENKNET